MKKIFFALTMSLFSGLLFAENFLKDYIAEFLNKGGYIAIEDGSDSTFYPKHILVRLECDNDDLKFTYSDEEYEYETESFSIKKYLIKIDENSNIIISKK